MQLARRQPVGPRRRMQAMLLVGAVLLVANAAWVVKADAVAVEGVAALAGQVQCIDPMRVTGPIPLLS